MSFFFLLSRIIRIAYVTLRAAAGFLIVSHGIVRWVNNHR
jgi:hypothetical protein